MAANDSITKITDNLLKVYDYAFLEGATYGFYKPNDAMYAGVRMTEKQYHCPGCGRSFSVKIRNDNDGILYFSRSRIAEQKKIYEELGLDFPADHELMEKPYTYHLTGYCAECADRELAEADQWPQRINNLCHALYLQDMLVSDKARQYMTDAVQRWLDGISEARELTRFDLANPEVLQELIWIMVLSDTEACEKALQEYRDAIQPLLYELKELLERATPAWKAYVARSSSLPESMSDGEYHEYTLAFPADDTQGQDFYFRRSVEKSRVGMFVSQRRISSIQELLADAGFQERWIDMVMDKANELLK
ncbi:hypothetical protein [Anaerovibrio sp.]|uniref:hypothetical protein n=1 Tax=Anaerovibrio sp. TaxID=1872532 RepID=UPI003F17A796